MNIRCSADHEVKTTAECLACAQNPNHPCDISLPALMDLYREAPRKPGLHVSDIVGCLLKGYNNAIRERPIRYPSELAVMKHGTNAHAALEKAGSDPDAGLITEQNMTVEFGGVPLHGTFDCYMVQSGLLLDYKTTRWIMVNKLPYAKHELQCQIYTLMMRKLGYTVNGAQIQYIDLTGPTKCRKCNLQLLPMDDQFLKCPGCEATKSREEAHEGYVIFNVDILAVNDNFERWLTERVVNLARSIEMGIAPEGESGPLCNYCDWRVGCPFAPRS